MALADRVAARTRGRHGVTAVAAVPGAERATTQLWEGIHPDFAGLLGGGSHSRAGAPVNFDTVNGVAAWYSGVRYLAETIAGLEVRSFRRVGLGPGAHLEPRADPVWYRSGDPEQTWFGFIEHTMMSLLHAGNAYAFKVRNTMGQVVALRELHPRRVTVGLAPDGTKRFRIDTDHREWTVRDVLHIPGLAYNGRIGLNPLQVHTQSMGAVVAADEYAQRFYGQGTHMGGVISVPQALTPTQRAEAKADWDAFHQGLAEAHMTGVLGNGASYTKLGLNAEDAQLLESRQYGVVEVARMLRIPPHKLYELSRATFSNIEQQSIEAVQDGIIPWCRRISAWVNNDLDLLPGRSQFIQFDTMPLLQGDMQSTYSALMSAGGGPFLTRNESRVRIGMEPVEGLDEMLYPVNMGVVGQDPPPNSNDKPAPPAEEDETDDDDE